MGVDPKYNLKPGEENIHPGVNKIGDLTAMEYQAQLWHRQHGNSFRDNDDNSTGSDLSRSPSRTHEVEISNGFYVDRHVARNLSTPQSVVRQRTPVQYEPHRSSVASVARPVDTTTQVSVYPVGANFGFYEYRGHAMLETLRPLPPPEPSRDQIELRNLAQGQPNYFADAEDTEAEPHRPCQNSVQSHQQYFANRQQNNLPLSIDGLHEHVKNLQDKIECLEKENEQLEIAAGAKDDAGSIQKVWHRLAWLVSLLLLQSVSSIILESFSNLIKHHAQIMLKKNLNEIFG